MNPLNYVRLVQSFGKYATRQHAQTMDPSEVPRGCVCTRSEELEDDDVSPDAQAHYIQRLEPQPWGTLRLNDYGDRFNEAVKKHTHTGFKKRVGGDACGHGDRASERARDRVSEKEREKKGEALKRSCAA